MSAHVCFVGGGEPDERVAAIVALAVEAYLATEVSDSDPAVSPPSRWAVAGRLEAHRERLSPQSLQRGWRAVD